MKGERGGGGGDLRAYGFRLWGSGSLGSYMICNNQGSHTGQAPLSARPPDKCRPWLKVREEAPLPIHIYIYI